MAPLAPDSTFDTPAEVQVGAGWTDGSIADGAGCNPADWAGTKTDFVGWAGGEAKGGRRTAEGALSFAARTPLGTLGRGVDGIGGGTADLAEMFGFLPRGGGGGASRRETGRFRSTETAGWASNICPVGDLGETGWEIRSAPSGDRSGPAEILLAANLFGRSGIGGAGSWCIAAGVIGRSGIGGAGSWCIAAGIIGRSGIGGGGSRSRAAAIGVSGVTCGATAVEMLGGGFDTTGRRGREGPAAAFSAVGLLPVTGRSCRF